MGNLLREAKTIRAGVMIYSIIFKRSSVTRKDPLKGHALLQLKLMKKRHACNVYEFQKYKIFL